MGLYPHKKANFTEKRKLLFSPFSKKENTQTYHSTKANNLPKTSRLERPRN